MQASSMHTNRPTQDCRMSSASRRLQVLTLQAYYVHNRCYSLTYYRMVISRYMQLHLSALVLLPTGLPQAHDNGTGLDLSRSSFYFQFHILIFLFIPCDVVVVTFKQAQSQSLFFAFYFQSALCSVQSVQLLCHCGVAGADDLRVLLTVDLMQLVKFCTQVNKYQ